jgi:hypothetical protein
MDAELAASVIDDAFEALGTAGCRYLAPGETTPLAGLTLLRHRRSSEREKPGFTLGRGGLETTDRPQAIIVRRSEVPQPLAEGVFVMPRPGLPDLRFRIGEDPLEDDINGLSWRCSVEVLPEAPA